SGIRNFIQQPKKRTKIDLRSMFQLWLADGLGENFGFVHEIAIGDEYLGTEIGQNGQFLLFNEQAVGHIAALFGLHQESYKWRDACLTCRRINMNGLLVLAV